MFGTLADLFSLFAQVVPAGGKQPEPSPYLQFLPLLPIPLILYFMLIRPQQTQEKRRRDMVQKLKKNDKVLTAAGMYGTVISVDDQTNRVVLRLDDDGKVKITFSRASIVQVLGDPAEKAAELK